jgi:hypothetical protein
MEDPFTGKALLSNKRELDVNINSLTSIESIDIFIELPKSFRHMAERRKNVKTSKKCEAHACYA